MKYGGTDREFLNGYASFTKIYKLQLKLSIRFDDFRSCTSLNKVFLSKVLLYG
jgi:hypothetical protein